MIKFIATYIENVNSASGDFDFPLDATLIRDNDGNIMTTSSVSEMVELLKKEANHYIENNGNRNLTIYEEDMRISIFDEDDFEVMIYNIHQFEI
jgi:hypothetical protein